MYLQYNKLLNFRFVNLTQYLTTYILALPLIIYVSRTRTRAKCTVSSQQSHQFDVLMQNHLMYIIEDLPHAARIGGNGEMIVTLSPRIVNIISRITLKRLTRDIDELVLYEALRPIRLIEVVGVLGRVAEIFKVWEIIDNMLASAYLTLHHVLLVQEDYEAGGGEKTILPHAPKQIERLLQTILMRVLAQTLIKVSARNEKENRLNSLEDLYPFVALIALTAHIVHAELLYATAHSAWHLHLERDLVYAGGNLATVQYVLGGWYVIGVGDAFEIVEETKIKKAFINNLIENVINKMWLWFAPDKLFQSISAHVGNLLFRAVQQWNLIGAFETRPNTNIIPQSDYVITIFL